MTLYALVRIIVYTYHAFRYATLQTARCDVRVDQVAVLQTY